MAKKISELNEINTLQDGDVLVVVRGNENYKISKENVLVKIVNQRIVNAAVNGTYNLDHSLASDWKLTLDAATTLTDVNLPNNTTEFTLKIIGDFALTLPSYWSVNGDDYDGSKWNFFAVQIHDSGTGTEEATVFITNLK